MGWGDEFTQRFGPETGLVVTVLTAGDVAAARPGGGDAVAKTGRCHKSFLNVIAICRPSPSWMYPPSCGSR
eukprot:3136792-Rhodomonas_salina.1